MEKVIKDRINNTQEKCRIKCLVLRAQTGIAQRVLVSFGIKYRRYPSTRRQLISYHRTTEKGRLSEERSIKCIGGTSSHKKLIKSVGILLQI